MKEAVVLVLIAVLFSLSQRASATACQHAYMEVPYSLNANDVVAPVTDAPIAGDGALQGLSLQNHNGVMQVALFGYAATTPAYGKQFVFTSGGTSGYGCLPAGDTNATSISNFVANCGALNPENRDWLSITIVPANAVFNTTSPSIRAAGLAGGTYVRESAATISVWHSDTFTSSSTIQAYEGYYNASNVLQQDTVLESQSYVCTCGLSSCSASASLE